MTESNKTDIVKIIAAFVAAVTNVKLYPPTHPQAVHFVDRLYSSIMQVFETEPELTLVIVDNDIIAYGRPLVKTGDVEQSFVNLLHRRGIERITLLAGLPKYQLLQFISDLANSNVESIAARSHIKLGKVLSEGLQEGQSRVADEFADILSFQSRAAAELKAHYHEMLFNKRLDIDEVKELVADFIKIFDRSINPLRLLSTIKSDDEYTYVHITNVAMLTISFADFLGFSVKHLHDIGTAALLHDVGKMAIPDEILNKPGPLDPYERAVMETHTIRGAQYIGRQDNIPRLTILAALEHHIRYDGTGYPKISENWQPNIVSQMISVADVYDALRSRRPYHEAIDREKVTAILCEDSGTVFNPALVENFLAMIEH